MKTDIIFSASEINGLDLDSIELAWMVGFTWTHRAHGPSRVIVATPNNVASDTIVLGAPPVRK